MDGKSEMHIEKEELIQKLFELAFKKAEIESKETSAYGISRYINNALDNKINERTLTRYYDGYILGRESERMTPNEYNLSLLSEYLGYKNFEKFELSLECEIEKEKLKRERGEIQKKLRKVKLIGLICSIVLFVISTLFISKYYKKNCMIWVDDHYEKIRCSGLDNEKKLVEVELQNLIKVEVCKDSTFFVNGEPVIHYTRHNNITDFFTDEGEHPIYDGVYTKPITQTIIDSRVKPCDSIKID